MNRQKFCFLQVSDRLLNPDDTNNPADNYFKALWDNMAGEGYYKPRHYWEIPTWIAELNHCIDKKENEAMLHHIETVCPENCTLREDDFFQCLPVLPEADIYFASVLDCNKDILARVVRNNPDKEFHFGGYIGEKSVCEMFGDFGNVYWHTSIENCCIHFNLRYKYGTDYSLFKGMKCIPRLTLSNGCTNHCKFCTVPDEITETAPLDILQQIKSMEDLDFELIYINDKTFGQASNIDLLKYAYTAIKDFNPKFRGFTVQTTCHQVLKWALDNVSLKDLHIVNVEIGVESYNDDILKKYRKPQSTKTIDKALHFLKWQFGVNVIPNIIIGLPGENIYTYWNTLNWILKNKQDFLMLNVTNFVPYVGSEASDIVKTTEDDLNQTVCKRSYHTAIEARNVEMFTEVLFRYGMEIIEATKARAR